MTRESDFGFGVSGTRLNAEIQHRKEKQSKAQIGEGAEIAPQRLHGVNANADEEDNSIHDDAGGNIIEGKIVQLAFWRDTADVPDLQSGRWNS
ncbi:MAG: hypothetical protein ACLR23_16060 [Clostridia bacterium]